MEKVKTATGKEFDCDYFNPFPPMNQVNLNIWKSTVSEVAAVFGDPKETKQLSYCGQTLKRHTKLMGIIPEGKSIRVVLGKE